MRQSSMLKSWDSQDSPQKWLENNSEKPIEKIDDLTIRFLYKKESYSN